MASPALPFQRTYYPQARPLRLITNSQIVLEQAARLWDRYPALSAEPAVDLIVRISQRGRPRPLEAPLYTINGRLVSIHAEPENAATADLRAGVARGSFTDDCVAEIDYWRYHFLEPLGYLLVAARHFTLLHAASVALDGRAVLLCGDSGAGKTCLAFAAARKGWTYISGDATALVRGAPLPQLVGRPFEVRLRHTAARIFPELADHAPAARPNGKLDFEVDPAAFGVSTALEARAAAVVFLKRTETAQARTEPIPPRECARRLESSICFGDADLRSEQKRSLDALLRLPLLDLRYQSFDQAEQALRRLLEGGS